MIDPSPLYVPIAEHLPAVYREDVDSFLQIEGYLSLIDALQRAYLGTIEDFPTLLSPWTRRAVRPDRRPGDPWGESLAGHAEILDTLAEWTGWPFPPNWEETDEEESLDRKRTYLLRSARLWRRRGTPRGFLEWFCFYFGIALKKDRPILIEHFKYRDPSQAEAGRHEGDDDDAAHRITLLVRLIGRFRSHARRREVRMFVERTLPAHLLPRVCWVPPDFALDLSDVEAVREVLCKLVTFTPEEDGVHLVPPEPDTPLRDRLGSGRLPGGGDVDDTEDT